MALNKNFDPDRLKGVRVEDETPAEEDGSTIKEPRRIPRFGTNEIQEDDKLVVLKVPKSNDVAWNDARPAYRQRAVFYVTTDSGERFGPFPDVDNRGGYAFVEIDNLVLAPQLRLVVWMSRTGEISEPTETFGANFAFCPIKVPGQDDLRHEISDVTVEKNADGKLVVNFTTEGCRLTNVYAFTDFDQHNLHKRSKLKTREYDILSILRRLGLLKSGSESRVTLEVSETDEAPQEKKKRKRTAMDDLADALFSASSCKISYPTYRSGTGNLAIQLNMVPPRHKVLSKLHHGLPMRAVSNFQSNDQACITLAMASILLGEEQKVYLKSIELNLHTGRVYAVGDVVFVSLSFSAPLVTGLQTAHQERIQFPDRCEMKLHMHGGNDKAIHAVGQTMGDIFKLQGDLLVLLTNKSAENFLGLTTPISRDQSTSGRVFKIKVQTKINEVTTATRVDAVNSAYTDANKPDLPDWKPAMLKWAFLLNDGKRLPAVNPFAEAQAKDRVKFAAEYKKLLKSWEWTRDQREYFQKLLSTDGGLLLVSGPAGAGKTALLAYTARFAQDNSMKALVTNMNNSALDHFCNKYAEYFPNAEPPLRVYSARLEDPTAVHISYEPLRNDKKEILMFQAIVGLAKTKGFNRGATQFSVEVKLQQLMDNLDSQPIMGWFTNGYDEETKQPIIDGDETDMLEYARTGVAKLKSHHITDEKEWTEDDARRLRQSIKICRAKIISDAPLIVATCMVAANKEMRQYFASDYDDKVLALFDEGPTVSEPDALAPIAKTNYAPKITGIVMVGDLQQLGPINIAGDGTDNTVNEFLSQMNLSLFARMMRAGHPVHILKHQSRQHEVLATPIRDLHYDRGTINAPNRNLPLKDHKDLIPSIRGPLPGNLEWDEYTLRLLWVEIENSQTEKYPGSASTANRYHIKFFMDKILPALQKEYPGEVFDKCMIITPYRLQKETYERAFREERCKGVSSDNLPQIYTVDSGQGHEAENVIIDVTQCSKEGFLADLSRMNVTFSRGKERHIILSGPLNAVRGRDMVKLSEPLDKDSTPVQYMVNSSALLHHKQYAFNHDCLIQVEVSGPMANWL